MTDAEKAKTISLLKVMANEKDSDRKYYVGGDGIYCSVEISGLREMAQNVIELLKEREPVTPKKVKGNFCCGKCLNPLHTAIVNPMIEYCDHCGSPVNWKG